MGREAVSKLEKETMHVEDGYRRAVIQSGGIPFMILPVQNNSFEGSVSEMTKKEEQELISILNLCDGIIMPGGHRIFEYDKFICKYALDNDIPLLGICLGMQVMASVDCSPQKTIKLIDTGVIHKITEKFAHKFKVNKDSFLYNIVENEEFMVNSRHKCNITKTNNFDIVRIFRRWNN